MTNNSSEVAHQSWSIIVLCYNEEGSIKNVVHDVQQKLAILSNTGGEIVLVNDGSSDNSHAVIQQLLSTKMMFPIHYIHHKVNKGIGASLRAGYQKAQGDNVVMVPGDGQFDLKEFLPYKNLPDKHILAFYRVENMTYTLSRNILSWVNFTFNKLFIGLNLKDVNWVKVYKNNALKALDLELQSSLVESEICSKLIYLGHTPIQRESKYLPRTHGKSKGASFNIVRQAFLDMIKLILVFRRFVRQQRQQKP